MGRNCGLSGMAVGKWQRCVATFLYEGSRKSLDYISCILDVEGQRGIDRLKMFERQCCMDASGGEIVQLSTGKDDSNVHPPRIGEASAILVVGSPQFHSAPLLLRPPL